MADNQVKVLIIDDDESIRTLYLERLKAEGFVVEIATNGENGLAKVTNFKPDIILLDVMMPKINGFAVLEILKTTPEYKKIPVIILSALIQEEDKKRGREGGAVAFLSKSESLPTEVVAKIKAVIAKNKK